MREAIVAASTLIAVIVMMVGSYAMGRFSISISSQAFRLVLLAAGISTPLLMAAGLFVFVAPAREMTYNLVPFGLAILILPISTAMTFWGKAINQTSANVG